MLTVVASGQLLVLRQTLLSQLKGILAHDGGHVYGNPLVDRCWLRAFAASDGL